jgi:WH1 domain
VCLGENREVLINVAIDAVFSITRVSQQFAKFQSGATLMGLNFPSEALSNEFVRYVLLLLLLLFCMCVSPPSSL